MTEPEIEQFLAETRLGMFTTLRKDGSPVTVPVWFEWDGSVVRVFVSADSAKVRRITRDPRATLLAANHISEPEAWVAFDGTVTISDSVVFELAERMAHRYWDIEQQERRATVDSWREAAPNLRVLSMSPARIRSYKD
ncbi:MAG: TIGR03618 family F420-dependent PPOX class oxidoreductase [Dehalococcoidia bacterium]